MEISFQKYHYREMSDLKKRRKKRSGNYFYVKSTLLVCYVKNIKLTVFSKYYYTINFFLRFYRFLKKVDFQHLLGFTFILIRFQ